MNSRSKKFVTLSLVTGFIFQLAACGTIIHPERKGQRAGNLDTNIVVLNAIGLLFFMVPGVIAFAVDFNNGTIYLPGGSASINSDEINVVSVQGDITQEKIEQIVFDQTGKAVCLDKSDVQVNDNTFTVSSLAHEIRML